MRDPCGTTYLNYEVFRIGQDGKPGSAKFYDTVCFCETGAAILVSPISVKIIKKPALCDSMRVFVVV